MKFLIIDTSDATSFVCLWDKKGWIIEHLPMLKQSETLLPAIQRLLKNHTINFIAIGIGPGSFTGTRVGVMTAKTLAFALNIPLVPFCSIKMYTPNVEGSFALFSDAKSLGTFVLEGLRTFETALFNTPYIKKEKHPPSNELNLSFLGKYLHEKFLISGGTPLADIDIYYLK